VVVAEDRADVLDEIGIVGHLHDHVAIDAGVGV